jgi:hypothetical protein
VPRNPVLLALLMAGEIWLAHAVAFFTHEYAHSVTAWALGFKANPLLLHFGNLSLANLLAMIDINEHVDYGPIFAGGHGGVAALIAAAGVLSAVPLYGLSLLGYRTSGDHPALKLLFYLLGLMGAGNFLDYVPTRTFSPEGDMFLVEKGLGVTPWVLLLVLGIPFLLGMVHFFLRLLPEARRTLFSRQRSLQIALVVLSTFLFFVFFGAAGLESGAGVIAHRLALIFIFVAFPIATFALWPRRQSPSPELSLDL